MVAPSEQRNLRNLASAPNCNAEAVGYQSCKSSTWYWECLPGWPSAIARPVAPGTGCCNDTNRIFQVTSGTPCPGTSPTQSPSDKPSAFPSDEPSASPSDEPSTSPSDSPSQFPSALPSDSPTKFPSVAPSDSPSAYPTITCEGRSVGDQWCFNGDTNSFKTCSGIDGSLIVEIGPLAPGTKCCTSTVNPDRIIQSQPDLPCPTV